MKEYRSDLREKEVDKAQAIQYEFPYHYIPNLKDFPMLSKYWSWSVSYLAAVKIFDEWLFSNFDPRNENQRHMDFGCGDGGFLHQVSLLDKHKNIIFYGLDYDEHAINWANMFSRSNRFTSGDIKALPASFYDSGSLVEVYEHIPPSECPEFLESLASSLKKNAPLFITVPSTQKPIEHKHYRHFDFELLKKEFEGLFLIEKVFGFEKKSFLSRLINRCFHTP